MKKETLKTIVLVLLVLSSIILTANNWFSEKLWPDGYNFFSNIGFSKLYTNIISYFHDDDEYKIQAVAPEKIIINTGDQTTRISLNSNEKSPILQIWKMGMVC